MLWEAKAGKSQSFYWTWHHSGNAEKAVYNLLQKLQTKQERMSYAGYDEVHVLESAINTFSQQEVTKSGESAVAAKLKDQCVPENTAVATGVPESDTPNSSHWTEGAIKSVHQHIQR